MYCLIDFCCICFDSKKHLQPLSSFGSDNITYFIKLISCVPEVCFNHMNNKRLVCNKCCETMDTAYKFRQRCLRSKATLTDYISQLHQVSNISGVANVYLTDLNKFAVVKKECQIENYMEKIEMFINVNENTNDENFVINSTTEIKRENNQISLKLIETGHYIQVGNIIIEMEQNNQNSDEHVDTLGNIVINQDDNKSNISQNDMKLTASAIKNENENQDFEEHLNKKCDNILETFDTDSNDMAIKVEENNDYLVYSEKCFNDPSENLDEIKIDIVDNDIESMKSEIYIQNKSEDSEEFSTEDNDLLLEDEDTADKEVNVSYKILKAKQKKILLSKKSKQKMRGAVNRKDKIVKKHECSICKKNFTRLSSLKCHMRIHAGKKPHECEVCQKKFTELSNLTVHKRIHTGEKLHECDVCQKKFNQAYDLKRHTLIHSGEKSHECQVCKKKLTHSFYLSAHMRIHTGIKPHECSVCQKKFSNSSHLKRHTLIHTGVKAHACDICQKKFTQSYDLKTHMRIHTGEKPHECEVCQKKFTQSSILKRHTLIHTGVKAHTCDVCQKKFSQASNLKSHMLIHIEEKPHECEVCQKKFNHSSHFNKHMLIHTGVKP